MRRRDGVDLSGSERTAVTFRELDDDEIAAYVATGEGRDKAGSYAAQGLGAVLIRSFEGCYYNVVGLPVALLIDLLKKV
jgi:septum formation protein